MTISLSWRFALSLPVFLVMNACSSSDRPTAPRSRPEFAIFDAVHEGGTPGFFFLPPMVAHPSFSGAFDADIATLNPLIAVCDVTIGPDANCGGTGGTPAVLVFTTTSIPAITVDLTTPQYQVNWDTQGPGFSTSHTYRVHITAGASGARRELGFADVLLTTTPGQVRQLATGDLIVLQDGRTLPIHFRIETGILGSVVVSAASASVAGGGTDLITAIVRDLHGAVLAGTTVTWAVATTPGTGVADAAQPLSPTTGTPGADGATSTALKASTCGAGTAAITATSAGLSATASVTVASNCWSVIAQIPLPSAAATVAVNSSLNKAYVSGGAGGESAVIDGSTFILKTVGVGVGVSVDGATNRYWAAVYRLTNVSGAVLVREGTSDALIASLGGFGVYCPLSTAADAGRRRIWVATQCGPGNNDAVYAIDADNFGFLAGPIGSGGTMGWMVVNTGTGRLYIGPNGASRRIEPAAGFTVTDNAFGIVQAVDPVTNRLYAFVGNSLQVIDGAPNPEVVLATISLAFNPSCVGTNSASNQVFIGDPAANRLLIIDGGNNMVLGTIPLAPGIIPQAIAVDPSRNRLYVAASTSSGWVLWIFAGA